MRQSYFHATDHTHAKAGVNGAVEVGGALGSYFFITRPVC